MVKRARKTLPRTSELSHGLKKMKVDFWNIAVCQHFPDVRYAQSARATRHFRTSDDDQP